MRHLATLMLIVGLCCGVAVAQTVPDFQTIMNNLPAKLNALGSGAWSNPPDPAAGTSPAYQWVAKAGQFGHNNPNFAGQNNYYFNNSIPDDAHLALFQKVLEGDACVREILGDSTVDGVRAAFFANQARVTQFEAAFDAEILKHETRVDIKYSVVSASNRPLGISRFTAPTGDTANVVISLDSGVLAVGNTSLNQSLDIPSLWGAEGLIDRVSPGFDAEIRDLLAAYLTMGEQAGVDYMQGVLFETFYCGVFPNIIDLILSLVDIKAEPVDFDMVPWEPTITADDKAFASLHTISDLHIYRTYNPPMNFDLGGGDYLRIRVVGVNIYGQGNGVTNMQTGVLQNWLNKYTVGANGFHAGYAARFGGGGDLDGNGITNDVAWLTANGDRGTFLVNAGTGVLFDWNNQIQTPPAPINYGGSHTMTATAKGGSGNPITYQWYKGETPASMSPIAGATGSTYTAPIDFYSWGPTPQVRYYKLVASTSACGSTIEAATTAVVTGGTPPPIVFNTQPQNANVLTGANHTFTVSATCGAGSPTLQWQRYDDDLGWLNIPGATAPTLTLTAVTAADAGDYRCRVFNQVAGGKSDKANPEYFADSAAAKLNVAPPIVFDVQPVSANLEIGDDYTLHVEASVADGNLEYRWFRNPGTGWAAVGSWVDAGGTSLVATLDINNAQLADSGLYRLSVRNTLAPFSPYTVNSANANVNVSSGVVFYVDPTGDDSDGLSWETAFNTLQPAIDAAAADPLGGEVWVAGGPVGAPIVYNEDRSEVWGDLGVTGSLVMKNNVALYGGFEGYRGGAGVQEANRLFRNRAQNIAVIDGSASNGGGAAYHVVVFGRETAATVGAALDGFVITGGNAAGVPGDYHTHRGGGIYNWGSAATIRNCVITGNSANVSGGGIANEINAISGTPGDATITNCVFSNNFAARAADGNAGPDGGSPIRGGGAIFNNGSAPVLSFLTIVNNSTDDSYSYNGFGVGSGALYTWNADTVLTNSIVYGNSSGLLHQAEAGNLTALAVTFSDIEGGFAGAGNIDVDPLLGNGDYTALLGASIGGYVPALGSPVVNAADPNVGGDDLLGVPRPIGAAADMGAFELSVQGPAIDCIASAPIDFITTPQLTDPFVLVDLDNAFFEAPYWKLTMENKVFGCADIPLSDIGLTAYDILGRAATCRADVPVTESEAPVAVCNALTVELDSSGAYTLTAADLQVLSAGSSDNCTAAANLTVTASPMAFDCDDAGKTVNVAITVEDSEGNTDTCTAQVTVEDNIAPTAATPANSINVELNALGNYTLSEADVQALAANATDNCAVNFALSTVDQMLFECSDIGANTVTVTWHDFHGNTVTGPATVNVADVGLPTLIGLVDRQYSIATGDFTLAQALAGVSATDVCDGDLTNAIVVEVFDADDNPVPFPVPTSWPLDPGETGYVFTIKYTVADNSGNEASGEVGLVFNAVKLPEITVLGDNPIYHECHTVYFYDDDPGATAWDPQGLVDITGLITTTFTVDQNVPGTYQVIYSVPVPGYPSLAPVVATRDVIVIDTIKPTITLSGSTTVISPLGEAYHEPGYTAFDSCAGSLSNVVVVTGAVDINTPGAYVLNYNVTDPEGNVADTKTRTVVVAEEVSFTRHPSNARKYSTDAPFTLEANYTGGFDLDGHEWFRDGVGLGLQAPETGGNTVTLTVNPASHPLGTVPYNLVVTDYGIFTYSSNNAFVEVNLPLKVDQGLADLAVQAGEEADWSIAVSGGLGNVTYQWYASLNGGKAFAPVVDGPLGDGAYAGATSDTLQLVPFDPEMVGQYQVQVSDDFSTITVGPANLILDYGIPAAGAIGIAVLALATALGGARALRKRD